MWTCGDKLTDERIREIAEEAERKGVRYEPGYETFDRAIESAIRQALAEAEERVKALEQTSDELLKERDHAQEMADKLAGKIAEDRGLDIGEHSNGNCPWTNALNDENVED